MLTEFPLFFGGLSF